MYQVVEVHINVMYHYILVIIYTYLNRQTQKTSILIHS